MNKKIVLVFGIGGSLAVAATVIVVFIKSRKDQRIVGKE